MVNRKRMPTIIDMIPTFINDCIARSADTLLPGVDECKIGTLRNIQLCNLMDFRTPTGISCDFQVSLHSITGAENIRITNFSYDTGSAGADDDEQLLFNIEIAFGVLVGTMSMKSTGLGTQHGRQC